MDWSEEVRARLDQASRGRAELRFCLPVQASDLQAALGEIKRLRAWEDGGQQFLAERDELRKEVERLQAEVAWWQEQSDTGRQIREKKRAEAALLDLREWAAKMALDKNKDTAARAAWHMTIRKIDARAALAGEGKP